jgi:hypothetical protein
MSLILAGNRLGQAHQHGFDHHVEAIVERIPVSEALAVTESSPQASIFVPIGAVSGLLAGYMVWSLLNTSFVLRL